MPSTERQIGFMSGSTRRGGPAIAWSSIAISCAKIRKKKAMMTMTASEMPLNGWHSQTNVPQKIAGASERPSRVQRAM